MEYLDEILTRLEQEDKDKEKQLTIFDVIEEKVKPMTK